MKRVQGSKFREESSEFKVGLLLIRHPELDSGSQTTTSTLSEDRFRFKSVMKSSNSAEPKPERYLLFFFREMLEEKGGDFSLEFRVQSFESVEVVLVKIGGYLI